MKRIPAFLTCSILMLASCAQVYQTTDAIPLAQAQRTIAIIPPTVSIAASKKIDAEAMKEQQVTESRNFQQEIYAWLLKRKMQDRMNQEILDLETTNAKLKLAGYPEQPMTPVELAEVLNVDGVINSNFRLSKPISEGAAIALAVLGAGSAATNEVVVSMNIYDRSTRKMIWNYDHTFQGTLGSSPTELVEGLMRNASKKMPYLVN